MPHPYAIVYRATQTHPVEDEGKSYFGHATVSMTHPNPNMGGPENRALNRRRNQHYYAAHKGNNPSPFQQALGAKGTRFRWTIVMVVHPPSGADGGNADTKWCAEAAEGWHIDHFRTAQPEYGYNRQLPPAVRAIVRTEQPMLVGRHNQYRGCRFKVPSSDDEFTHPEDAV